MFRTAILCSARAIAVRPATTGRTARLAHAAAASRTPSWSSSSAARLRRSAWAAVPARCYSSAGALTKEDVYARISTLLQGFDKVCVCVKCGRERQNVRGLLTFWGRRRSMTRRM